MRSSASSEWRSAFLAAVSDTGDHLSYHDAAKRLRRLIASELLRPTDILQHPQRFFEAHRLLAQNATRFGPGFFIRFTVHFNLFSGTIVALATPSQRQQMLHQHHQQHNRRVRLGCFALTECVAGVNSGLVTETTATWKNTGEFEINTPNDGAAKNWISQGLVADDAVVIADLRVHNRSFGPQAFFVQLRDEDGNLRANVIAEDMGVKTVGNDLDNARLRFQRLRVPADALLSRFVRVLPNGNVQMPFGKRTTIETIGQRLFTGRIAVAEAALEFAASLFASTRRFAEAKVCWAPFGRRPKLANIPQIAAILQQADDELQRLQRFVGDVEAQLCACLAADQLPSLQLQQAIAVAKVKCVERSIALCFALKQEVGSFALIAGTGFEQIDFLQCCKFAEGDSRILMQKMARDLVRGAIHELNDDEKRALNALNEALETANAANGGDPIAAWDSCFQHVYDAAEAHMRRVLGAYEHEEQRGENLQQCSRL